MTNRTGTVAAALLLALTAGAVAAQAPAAQSKPAQIRVAGQIYVDGNPPQRFQAQGLQISLVPVAPGATDILAAMSAEGSFRFDNVRTDIRYRVSVAVPLSGYVAQARYGDKNPLQSFEIQPDVSIQLMIGFQPAKVEAEAMNSEKPAPGATVVLVPSTRARTDLYRSGVAGLDGRVSFTDVVPGDYKLFAWTEVRDAAWLDEAFLSPFEDNAKLLRLAKSGSASVKIDVMRSR